MHAILLITALAVYPLQNTRPEISTSPTRGVVVEEIESSPSTQTLLQLGDVITAWESAEPGDFLGQIKGPIESPLDMGIVEVNHLPRGKIKLHLTRGGMAMPIISVPSDWKAKFRPWLEAPDLSVYLEARRAYTKANPDRAVSMMRQLGTVAQLKSDPFLAGWFFLTAAELSATGQRLDILIANTDSAIGELAKTGRADLFMYGLYVKARLLDKVGQRDKARTAYEAALKASQSDPHAPLTHAWIAYSLGGLAFKQGLLGEAEDLYRRALSIREIHIPLSTTTANNLDSIGNVALKRGDLDTAEALYGRALGIRRTLNIDGIAIARSLGNLALIAYNRSDLDTAEELATQALSTISREYPDHEDHGTASMILASIFVKKGDFGKAESLYRSALSNLDRSNPNSSSIADALDGLGTAVFGRGDLTTAYEFFRAALARNQQLAPNGAAAAANLQHIGAVLLEQGELATAEEYFGKALTIQNRLSPKSLATARTLSNLASIAWLRKNYSRAERLHQEALKIKSARAPGGLEVASTLYNLALVLEGQGKLAQASQILEQVVSIRNGRVPGSPAEAEAIFLLARVTYKLGDTEPAERLFEHSLNMLEAHSSRLGGAQRRKEAFRAAHFMGYRSYIDLLLSSGKIEKAFRTVERSRSRTLLEALTEQAPVDITHITPDLDTERKRLAQEHDRIYDLLQEYTGKGDRLEESNKLRSQLLMLLSEQSALYERMRLESPHRQEQAKATTETPPISQSLDPGTLLIVYHVGTKSTTAFFLTRETGLKSVMLPIGELELRAKTMTFRGLLAKPYREPHRARAIQLLGKELYNLLIEKFEPQIEVSKRIAIVADGPLHALPFGALTKEIVGNSHRIMHLAERRPVHMISSATLYAETLRSRKPKDQARRPSRFVVFGDPHAPEEERLLGSLDEAQTVASVFPGEAEVYLGAAATEEKAKQAMAGKDIIHFACHAHVDEDFPSESGLTMAIQGANGGNSQNGILQAWEISEQVRMDADLVVLAACDSAMGKELRGEGLLSLARAFQYAGARSVMASLWKISDRTTAELMVRFYKHLKEGKPKDEALRAAQMELIRGPIQVKNEKGEIEEIDASAPYYWAAFQIYGDWQ